MDIRINLCRHIQSYTVESASLVLYFRSHEVVQAYANTYATAVVYARCFIQELNKSAELYKDVTWPLGRGEDLLKALEGVGCHHAEVNDLPLGPAHPLTVARSTRSRPSRVESA